MSRRTKQQHTSQTMLKSGLLGALSAFATFGVAHAQSADEASTFEEEIVVTAQRREQNLQDVPIAITVLDDDALAARGINYMRELEYSVPNLVVSGPDTSMNLGISLRGISSDSRNIGFESGLSMYVDGVYTGRPSSFNIDMLDVERIEVLRGPQGTLYGKNTTAGAINITTRAPDDNPQGVFEVQYGDYDAWRGRASVSGPLVPGRVAGLIGGFVRRRDGYQTNLAGGDLYSDDASGAVGRLRFTPNDALELIISADYLTEDYAPNVNEIAPGGFGSTGIPRVVDIDAPVFQTRDVFGASVSANLDLGPATLTSITGYRSTDIEFLSDDDGSSSPFLTSHFADDQGQWSQEFRIASSGEHRLQYVAGIYLYHQDITTSRLSALRNLLPFPVDVSLAAEVETDSYAVFGQLDYALTDALTLSGGLRLTHEEKTLDMNLIGSPLFGIATVTINGQEHEDDDVSGAVSLIYEASENVNFYARIASGFKAGGFNADYVPSADVEFDPETAVSYEIGLKSEFPAQGLRANIALFYTDYRDLQVSTFNVFSGFTISNAATATILGAEADISYEPVRNLVFTTALGYLDATFDRFPNAGGLGVDFDGNRLADAPEWTASVAADYIWELGEAGAVTAHVDYSYRDDYYYDPDNAPSSLLDGYGLLGARLGYETAGGMLRVEAWGRNLTDELYETARGTPVLGAILGQTYVTYGAPQTYGVRLVARY